MTTIYDIAAHVGVSHGTVSRVLNGADYRRPTFRKRAETIRRVAAEMGYRPNTSAQAVRRGTFQAITLLMSNERSRSLVTDDMLFGLQSAARRHGLSVQLATVSHDRLNDEDYLPHALGQWHSDGMLVNFQRHPPARLGELLERYRVPAVWMNADVPHDVVRPDDRAAAREATEHLLSLGHKKIWFVQYSRSPDTTHYSELHRQDGYEQAMHAAGLRPTTIDRHHPTLGYFPAQSGLTDTEVRNERWAQALSAPDRPTALVLYGGSTNTVFPVAAAMAGLRVPRDLSLVTFVQSNVFAGFDYTAWKVPVEDVGARAVDALVRKIAAPAEAIDPICLPFSLSQGQTVAPPADVSR
ncbi:MAG: LacI family DNA-binding transcriptional regulator [Planctomycetota bacterium]